MIRLEKKGKRMRLGWRGLLVGVCVVVGAGRAGGEVTRVATFENYVEGDHWFPSFTDPASGITFRDPVSGDKFVIEYSSSEFGGGNYLRSVGVTHATGFGSAVKLRAYDELGGLVGELACLRRERARETTIG